MPGLIPALWGKCCCSIGPVYCSGSKLDWQYYGILWVLLYISWKRGTVSHIHLLFLSSYLHSIIQDCTSDRLVGSLYEIQTACKCSKLVWSQEEEEAVVSPVVGDWLTLALIWPSLYSRIPRPFQLPKYQVTARSYYRSCVTDKIW